MMRDLIEKSFFLRKTRAPPRGGGGMPELLLHYKGIITEDITRSHRGLKNRNENTGILMLYREKNYSKLQASIYRQKRNIYLPKERDLHYIFSIS